MQIKSLLLSTALLLLARPGLGQDRTHSGMQWWCPSGGEAVFISAEFIFPEAPTPDKVGLAFWAALNRPDVVVQPVVSLDDGTWNDELCCTPYKWVQPAVRGNKLQQGDHVYFSIELVGASTIVTHIQVNNDPTSILEDVWLFSEAQTLNAWIDEERQPGDSEPMINHLWRNITVMHNCPTDLCSNPSSETANVYAVDNPTSSHNAGSNLTTCHYDNIFFQPINQANAKPTSTAWSAIASAAATHLAAASSRPAWGGSFASAPFTNVFSVAPGTIVTSFTATNYPLTGATPVPASAGSAAAVNASPNSASPNNASPNNASPNASPSYASPSNASPSNASPSDDSSSNANPDNGSGSGDLDYDPSGAAYSGYGTPPAAASSYYYGSGEAAAPVATQAAAPAGYGYGPPQPPPPPSGQESRRRRRPGYRSYWA